MAVGAVLFVTANPSIGTTLFIDGLELGTLNRTTTRRVDWADGKAVIGGRAFRALGGSALAVYPADDSIGAELTQRLVAELVATRPVPIADQIRRTYSFSDTSVDPPIETEVLECGPLMTRGELERFSAACVEEACNVSACCISGSLPTGCAANYYASLIGAIKRANPQCSVLLDASGAALVEGVRATPDCVKINELEYGELLDGFGIEAIDPIQVSVPRVAQSLGLRVLIVTRGRDSVIAWSCEEGLFEAVPPSIQVVNTIGCGDCFSAGYLVEPADPFAERVRTATAVAAANAEGAVPGEVKAKRVSELRNGIRVEKIGAAAVS